jgi:hypothetical protein
MGSGSSYKRYHDKSITTAYDDVSYLYQEPSSYVGLGRDTFPAYTPASEGMQFRRIDPSSTAKLHV